MQLKQRWASVPICLGTADRVVHVFLNLGTVDDPENLSIEQLKQASLSKQPQNMK